MFQRLISFSISHKVAVGVLSLALVVWGVASLATLPFDSTPDITNNQVQVITQAPSLGAQEVEQYITTPIEAAMANIPRLETRRSISRSGLSVVTLVFDDGADIYWAREQVSQQLKEAEKDIGGLGNTSLGPISTGLGEIYHYTVRAGKGYEGKYSLTELRTIQDWIVRKQLAGTKELAEVSGWGGFVKEYEVAVDGERLNAAGVTIPEIYAAIADNNENTGGSYIEQDNRQYYIRGIGVARSLDDIRNIPVKTGGATPVRVGDVADVRYGTATRFGAVTRNGEGEVVAGIALMLKGENFQDVSRRVKERIAQIQKSLPEGVVVEPFIDRTQLVSRVERTIGHNLVMGGLIVVFILVLFLGNLRAGIVVASVIPLSMLFAFGMMRVSGLSGNLMSLGAIDFGMIVDSAVIIVEAVCLHIAQQRDKYPSRRLTQREMDAEVLYSASKIRKSAAFGEIIIMVVYIPLMTLTGIEGKMFRPMAMTIFFAILGAFILSLTYVPMASAVFLSKRVSDGRDFSHRMVGKLRAWYRPVLEWAIGHNRELIAGAVCAFAVSLAAFGRLGGEFIPSLEEGDFTAEVSMAQGTSLGQMTKAMTLGEKLLREKFPEVRQVVTRIGSAEIPTDPMPVERADMMIALRPKAEWTSAKTKDGLMEQMARTLETIPGLDVEMSQPIQMRNNELITGIRQDVAVKIYGEDLGELTRQAGRVAKAIEGVPGVADIYVEKVQGLPQVQVAYNRERMAEYGISVKDANNVLKAAYAGAAAGAVYEGEKKFSIVVRMESRLRNNAASLAGLFIPLPGGGAVPLSQVASIDYADAPAQITHDEGTRRIYVGFNVRGRDVESTVGDVERVISKRISLPAGYYYKYGGEFKNLRDATRRLAVAIPAALLLILLLLYATVGSVRETLFVFSAIPLAAIGGIWALWLRGMPFSISAGVGFIALFGVAVLNGIVLIGQLNDLQREGEADVTRRIIEGCMIRLRPVLMTALVASCGFLPMALSHGDGAEVQRPLATVVIGGLVTSTLLTLVVLPAIYKTFTKK